MVKRFFGVSALGPPPAPKAGLAVSLNTYKIKLFISASCEDLVEACGSLGVLGALDSYKNDYSPVLTDGPINSQLWLHIADRSSSNCRLESRPADFEVVKSLVVK
jgi:hypothetical protein